MSDLRDVEFVDVEIELEDEIFLLIAKEAHKEDITFNEMINIMLKEMIDKERKDNVKSKE